MFRISEPVFEALRDRHEASFLNRVGRLLHDSGIDTSRDHLRHLNQAGRARGLRSERDCAAFIAVEALLLREPAHAAWANNELVRTEPLSIRGFVNEARRRCAEYR